jgi:hypothetical protein
MEMLDDRIARVGVELAPESWSRRHIQPLRAWLAARAGGRPVTPATPTDAAAPAARPEAKSRTSEA